MSADLTYVLQTILLVRESRDAGSFNFVSEKDLPSQELPRVLVWLGANCLEFVRRHLIATQEIGLGCENRVGGDFVEGDVSNFDNLCPPYQFT